MIDDRYEVSIEFDAKMFKFISEGPKGNIVKMVYYSETSRANIYNLSFGDYNELIDDIDDQVVTNNGDSQKVLATVAKSLFTFTNRFRMH